MGMRGLAAAVAAAGLVACSASTGGPAVPTSPQAAGQELAADDGTADDGSYAADIVAIGRECSERPTPGQVVAMTRATVEGLKKDGTPRSAHNVLEGVSASTQGVPAEDVSCPQMFAAWEVLTHNGG